MKCLLTIAGLLSLFFVHTMSQFPLRRRNLMAPTLPLSCTPSCNELKEMKDTPDVVCSCSSSCLIYGDCCLGAPFSNTGETMRKLGCLKLSGLGAVSIVDSCPTSSSSILSEACTTGLGATNPVTSKETGVSYSNHYCALCNRDSFNLVDWPVQFRCCEQDSKITAQTVKEYLEYDQESDVMRTVSELRDGSRAFCECKFYAQNGDLNFTMSLELRECKREEISSCIHSWDDESVEQLCKAYMDPVYNGQKVYRNRHCANCNYVHSETLKCSEEPFKPLNHRLMSPTRLISFCRLRNIPTSTCIYYLRSRGVPVSFSHIFTMKKVGCSPPPGRKCCDGQRYDKFQKKCRDLPKRSMPFGAP